MKSLIMRRPQIAVLCEEVWALSAGIACADTMVANPPSTPGMSVLLNANHISAGGVGAAPDSSAARTPVITPTGLPGRVHDDRFLRSAHHCGQRFQANL